MFIRFVSVCVTRVAQKFISLSDILFLIFYKLSVYHKSASQNDFNNFSCGESSINRGKLPLFQYSLLVWPFQIGFQSNSFFLFWIVIVSLKWEQTLVYHS
jgi:hypothetical protein